jgi:hypothetical protein
MTEDVQPWGVSAQALSQHEFEEEIEIAKRGDGELLHSVFAGTFVRAFADCRRCPSACLLWFMDDSEDPRDVCPNFDFCAAGKRLDDAGAAAEAFAQFDYLAASRRSLSKS